MTMSPFRAIGLGITAIFILMAVVSPFLGDASEFLSNPVHDPPSWRHWFGTDQQGHDVFLRVVAGAGVAWQVLLASTLVSCLVGVPLGLVSGYWGGWLDRLLVFVMDTLYTIPSLLIAIAIAFVAGQQGIITASIALSVGYIPQYFRVVRSQTLSLKTEPYIEAARAIGISTAKILGKYIGLMLWQTLPILFSLNAADAILTLAGLGFLGLGVPAELPEWGHDLKQALDVLATGEPIWWTTLFPGLAMTLMATGLALLAESIEFNGQRH
ncbi:MAG: ABC transporter permease [Pseudanabaenaceae cyanobacterium]